MFPECKPGGEFSGLIEKYWMVPRKGGDGWSTLEVFPDAHFALGFGLGNSRCKAFVGGPSTRNVSIPIADSMEFFFIRFRPGKMPRIADVSPAGLVDHTEDYIPRLLGMDADAIGERLLGATSLEGKTRIMESIFRSYGMNSVCQDHRCNQAVEMVESLEGRIKVVELSRELGISYQTLERMFLQQVGVTPKQFIRNIRFQKTMEKLKGGARFTTLGDLASECGFADQSHFIKEFKRLAQRLPSAF